MKFCPLLSTAEKKVECSEDCAFLAANGNCSIKNIGEADIHDVLDDIRRNMD